MSFNWTPAKEETYTVSVYCENCGHRTTIEVPKSKQSDKIIFWTPCPNCGWYKLKVDGS